MSVPGVEPSVLEDLAAASRILVDQGVFDQAGHTSMRHPGRAERFLMSRSLAPARVTPAQWQKIFPEQRQLVNVAYRQNVNTSIRQWDTSFQWPVAQGWNAIGRWNYSVPDRRALEVLVDDHLARCPETAKALATPALKERLASQGAVASGMSSKDFAALIGLVIAQG